MTRGREGEHHAVLHREVAETLVQGVARGVGQIGVEHDLPDAGVQRRLADGRGRAGGVAVPAQLRWGVDGSHPDHPGHRPGPARDRDRDTPGLPYDEAAIAEPFGHGRALILPGRLAGLEGERAEPPGQQVTVGFRGGPAGSLWPGPGRQQLAEPEQAHPAEDRDRVPGAVPPGRRERVGRLLAGADAGDPPADLGEIAGQPGGGRAARPGEKEGVVRRVHERGPDRIPVRLPPAEEHLARGGGADPEVLGHGQHHRVPGRVGAQELPRHVQEPSGIRSHEPAHGGHGFILGG